MTRVHEPQREREREREIKKRFICVLSSWRVLESERKAMMQLASALEWRQ